MKILLLNPPYRIKVNDKYEKYFVRAGSRWPYSEYKKIKEPSIYRPFPFFLAYAAKLLFNNNYSVEVVDGVGLQYFNKDFLEKVLSKNSDVIIIEIVPFAIENDINIVKEIKSKKKDSVIIAVGPFVSLLFDYIKEKNVFDYVINGEYEFAVLNLVNSLNSGRSEKIKGVISQNNFCNNFLENTDLIEPLDTLPFPYREIFPCNDKPDMNVYWDVFCQLRPAVQMHTSRGCPYKCYFCLWNQVLYKEGKYRTFSVKYVVDEMEEIVKKFNAKEIYIDDDDFTINKNRVKEICDEIIKRNLKTKWSCMGDIINLNEEIIYKMSEAGCFGIKFGVESVSKNVLKEIGKPVNIDKVKNVVKWCTKFGIRTHATFTFGLLGETKETMRETLDFAKSLDTDSVQFSIATPYPGTKFYDVVLENNFIKNFDWLNYDGSCNSVINYSQLSSADIESFYKNALKEWFKSKMFNFRWLFRQIKILFRTIFSQDIKYNYIFLKRIFNKMFR